MPRHDKWEVALTTNHAGRFGGKEPIERCLRIFVCVAGLHVTVRRRSSALQLDAQGRQPDAAAGSDSRVHELQPGRGQRHVTRWSGAAVGVLLKLHHETPGPRGALGRPALIRRVDEAEQSRLHMGSTWLFTYTKRIRFFGRSLEIPYYDDKFSFLIFSSLTLSGLGRTYPRWSIIAMVFGCEQNGSRPPRIV